MRASELRPGQFFEFVDFPGRCMAISQRWSAKGVFSFLDRNFEVAAASPELRVNIVLREELTAAQQRVAELEREVVTAKGFLSHAEADKAALTAENAALLDDNVRIALERDRLRELLRECREYVPADLQDFIDAELAKGE